MDASNLTEEQGRRLAASLAPMVGYLHRLAHRMQRLGWKADDPMYQAAWEAYHAVHALHVHAHYAGCGMVTGGTLLPVRSATRRASRRGRGGIPWEGKIQNAESETGPGVSLLSFSIGKPQCPRPRRWRPPHSGSIAAVLSGIRH
jgi:hypothetical protein